ncbi:mCG1038037 [Mus musculus]|uniref:Olfactory receptor n=1 Tax=Mus musculus TaxID=10090 RepID=Q8VFC0_MOUSE|nr:Olfactory receptor 203 [Mus musculus]AAL61274.1 olfactory receptor MOR182-5 [Mus musculus]AAP70790.1 olfactory receptor Olfr203 [Mus musculus]EDK98217.1 mCG1038037 [Mus musculus]
MEVNRTLVTAFILRGITDLPELQVPMFLVFFFIYVTTMVGNLGLIVLIWKDPRLHTPMYFFLGSLAFADACTSSSVTPRMLVNILDNGKMISLSECMAQYYVFGSSATTECFLLVAMAYDRYVAICNPLLYLVVMSNRVCTCLISGSYIIGFLHPLIHVGLLFRLTFCKSNIIDHFYCEILPLYTISCTDPSINAFVVFIFAAVIQAVTFMSIAVSYAHVLFSILKTKSEKGRRKAFSTCSAHLLSVSLFYGTLFFMYVSPGSGPSKYKNKMYSLFYTIVIPLLNPFIYSLRNKEVLGALRKIMKP